MRRTLLTMAALLVAIPGAAAAQGTAGGGGSPGSAVASDEPVDLSLADTEQRREENGFPWGLLGLVGLAGLLPRRRETSRR
jgi:MYXO-CTERM domain-containing protein